MGRASCFLPHACHLLSSAYCLLHTAHAHASDPGTTDWPMWGGTADRNMISNMKGMPTTWDVKDKKNVKWVAQLGFANIRQRRGLRRNGLRRH